MNFKMHQRKEKNEQSVQAPPDAILNLLPLLETSEYRCMEPVINLIHENLSGTKDSRLLNGIVDYYITVESLHSLDILVRLKDPHDKHLFDKISELMKNESYRYRSLQLLMNLVYRQPQWLHKIANHRIMHTLLNLLKTEQNVANLMSGLFILLCLLPMIPSQFGPFLHDTFEIFSKLAAWEVRKPSFIVDVYLVHLQVVIYSLFHRLYGMFPCNFLAYLRSFYGGSQYNEENYRVFSSVIKPMLQRVRLHPLLVTASKETELSTIRWKKMAYHDIIVECASISLDAIEGIMEPDRSKSLTLYNEQNVASYDSAQFLNCSNQSSCSVNYESEGAGNDSLSSRDMLWSPTGTPALSTPRTTSIATSPLLLKGEQEFKSFSRQFSSEEEPLDFAIEAKPELLKIEADSAKSSAQNLTLRDISYSKGTKDSEKANKNSTSEAVVEGTSILPAVEAKEDVDVDKEVSELTSQQSSSTKASATDIRHDTPFCSTTQNLTDEPRELSKAMSSLERADSLTKSHEEESEEMYNGLQEADEESFVPALSRYRCFSHHGPPPDIPLTYQKKPNIIRSISCPAKLCLTDTEQNTLPTAISCSGEAVPGSENAAACSSNATSSSAFVPVSTDSGVVSTLRLGTYKDLIPFALNPLLDLKRNAPKDFETSFCPQNLFLNSLSPPELLDRFIQMGSTTSLSHLGDIPITSTQSTDWTHFGGKPPHDEVTILRNQLLLLHNQLLFERHRKDVHSERNRRILGRAKRFKMQEEQIEALKEQIALLEQDNTDLKSQAEKKNKLNHHLLTEKQEVENDLNNKISEVEKENIKLLSSNTDFQTFLISQKQENDKIRELYKKCQLEIATVKHQVEHSNKRALQCQKVEKDAIFLSKQLILLQELISHYKDKMQVLKETRQLDIGANLINNACLIENQDLKQKLEEKSFQLDVTTTRLLELDQALTELKAKQEEQLRIFESMKSFHKDELNARDERIKCLKKISVQKDAHILTLCTDIETLSDEKGLLEEQVNSDNTSADTSYQSTENTAHGQSPCCSETITNPKSLCKDES